MGADRTTTFGEVLRRHWVAAGLTQEELAERAQMSVRGLSYVEKDARQPYRDTVRRLADALRLSAADRAALDEAAATTRIGPVADPRPARFPGLSDEDADAARTQTNVPLELSSFVGRERELATLAELLGQTRLLTLTGTGGVGKTRVAVHLAAGRVERYAQGVWLVELAPLSDLTLVPQAVATAVGVREDGGRSLLDALRDALRQRQLLLVLDNCEHLIATCAELAETLLRACPHLQILATSREALGIGGETVWRVPSLELPERGPLPPLQQLGQCAAVRLFVERAVSAQPRFALSAQNAAAVVAICRRLDGIPLALELAAACAAALPVAEVAARLEHSFRLLTRGSRTALPRQQTLRGTVDWSYDLLSEPERLLFARLSVFAGGFTLEAAEAVCAEGAIAEDDVLDLLLSLAQKSLLVAEEHDGVVARYRLLEPLRQYAGERLVERGEAAAVQTRHVGYYLALAEAAEPELRGPQQGVWLERLEREHDNLRAALAWSREQAVGELGLRLGGALWKFWSSRGYLSEGRRWLEAVLEETGESLTRVRATALHGAGALASMQGDYGRASALFEEALALRRDLSDTGGIAGSLSNLGLVALRQGDYGRASALFEKSLALSRELEDAQGIAHSLRNLGIVALDQGLYERASALFEEALALTKELGDPGNIAGSLMSLGLIALDQGDYGRAAALQEAALSLLRELGDGWGMAIALSNLGLVAQEQGDHGRAKSLFEESLALCRTLGDKRLSAYGLEGMAGTASVRGQPECAARLLGAADAARRLINVPIPPSERLRYDRLVVTVRAQLDEETFAAAWAAGQALTLEQAVAEALTGAVPT
jgi:non-specific serine/threonine protein kinase